MLQHPVQSRWSTQDIVSEVKQRGIAASIEMRFLSGRAEQGDVPEFLASNSVACPTDHGRALFDADDMTGSADRAPEAFEAQAGAATDIENRLA